MRSSGYLRSVDNHPILWLLAISQAAFGFADNHEIPRLLALSQAAFGFADNHEILWRLKPTPTPNGNCASPFLAGNPSSVFQAHRGVALDLEAVGLADFNVHYVLKALNHLLRGVDQANEFEVDF